LNTNQEGLASRAAICRTLGALHDPAARPALIKATSDTEPLLREEACRALGKVGVEEDGVRLNQIAGLDQYLDVKVAALDGLADLKPQDIRILQSLVLEMEDPSPAIRLGALIALQKISSKDLGIEPGPWKKYVEGRMAAEGASAATATQIATQSKPAIPANQVRQTRATVDDSAPTPTSRTPESWTRTPSTPAGTVQQSPAVQNPR
jgi:hypothetical protein